MQVIEGAVKLSGLGHRFTATSHWLYRNIDLSIASGESCAITGPSGSGKSTLLTTIAGWVTPTEGHIEKSISGNTQWVFQNPFGVPKRSAIDQVGFPLIARGESPEAADLVSIELCELVGLSELRDGRPFHALSGGEAQRLMLARALATNPAMLLVDEPTAQLDRASARSVNSAISAISKTGTVVIVASHDPETIAACNQFLDLGKRSHPK
ncbi:lipoprotein-releasing system ATP-binding protein [Aurantimicrobium minutum]|uniref:ATP-binding cassette domain-containing protein n=1 Tax=Aurantimicrobium minutum TaxID=708131 RepID=UPI0024765774|nr:ATP-binding cassette domain-containing protein [Aurantimicrobium minutum]MDH6277092.1 lipoprotein-releasing system ATP-binding protein [Aurantimicrobium minutum]